MANLSRRSGDGAKPDSGSGDLPRRVALWLVWAYPPRFRRDVGQGLVDGFAQEARRRVANGTFYGAILFLSLAARKDGE